jgi:deoxyadenosine/deoxycytidine kinase
MTSNGETEAAEQWPAGYYRAASARARRLEAEATTLGIKQYLRELIDRYDRLAEELESKAELSCSFAGR